MNDLQQLSESHGMLLVFLNVLLEQLGLPIPAWPTLIVAGALAMQNPSLLGASVLLAMLACLIADLAWYWAGQRYGGTLLRTICKISLSQDTCVRQGLNLYGRIGPRALLVSKFLPGAGALVTTVAGISRTPLPVFFRYSLAGSFIWAGSALLIGQLFADALTAVLDLLARYALLAGIGIAAALALFIAWKYFKRVQLLRRTARIPRISVDELRALQDGENTLPVILDVRPSFNGGVQGIPGAINVSLEDPLDDLVQRLADTDVVIYCACPHELSAALLAEKLGQHGVTRIQALTGGLDAWRLANDWLPEEDAQF
ncbi:DedA family protein/thiosulfate sulfurtransferase GlpE [Pseudomonas sp. Pseusp122]|uniref:DedA family protein/thiosulfate sulfurtransferase GlpE n=1 Tax=unclassified Pseudomonas TaxID=196821 RepID=UPI0039A6C819